MPPNATPPPSQDNPQDAGRDGTTSATTVDPWERTKWSTQRAEARERLAAQNIALAGIILALLPTLADSLAHLRWRTVLSGAVAGASALLALVTIWSLWAIGATRRRSKQQDPAKRAEDIAEFLVRHTRSITMLMAAAIAAIAIVLVVLMLAQGAAPRLLVPTSTT